MRASGIGGIPLPAGEPEVPSGYKARSGRNYRPDNDEGTRKRGGFDTQRPEAEHGVAVVRSLFAFFDYPTRRISGRPCDPASHGKVDEMIEEHERRDFFEIVTDEVALSRWLRRRIDEMKKLARELESAEDFMFDCVLRAESDDGQQQLPGVEKISPAERGLDLLRIGTRKVRDAINDARKPPNFAEERLKAMAEKIRTASGAAQ